MASLRICGTQGLRHPTASGRTGRAWALSHPSPELCSGVADGIVLTNAASPQSSKAGFIAREKPGALLLCELASLELGFANAEPFGRTVAVRKERVSRCGSGRSSGVGVLGVGSVSCPSTYAAVKRGKELRASICASLDTSSSQQISVRLGERSILSSRIKTAWFLWRSRRGRRRTGCGRRQP